MRKNLRKLLKRASNVSFTHNNTANIEYKKESLFPINETTNKRGQRRAISVRLCFSFLSMREFSSFSTNQQDNSWLSECRQLVYVASEPILYLPIIQDITLWAPDYLLILSVYLIVIFHTLEPRASRLIGTRQSEERVMVCFFPLIKSFA